jgi:hypothetical protein
MRIEIAKRADGAGVLRCTRDDGSVTWQKQTDRHAAHFSLHDLTHFAVETVLGFRRGFFGLINEGWDISETEGKSARGPLPQDACEVEVIVGLFDGERAAGTVWPLEQMQQYAGSGATRLTEDGIANVRKRRAELFAQWAAVPTGGVLELRF